MPRSLAAVVFALLLLPSLGVRSAGAESSILRFEAGVAAPSTPDLFRTRYDPSFSIRAVGDNPLGGHLCWRMSTEYAAFAHAKLPTYVSGGDAYYLGTGVGLSAWPLSPTSPVRPYVAGSVAYSTFQLKDVVIDTGGGPHTARGDLGTGLSHSVEIGAQMLPGSGRMGLVVAAEWVTIHESKPLWTHFTSASPCASAGGGRRCAESVPCASSLYWGGGGSDAGREARRSLARARSFEAS